MDRKAAIARIQSELVARQRSQRTVADALNVSKTAVSRIVAGTYPQLQVRSRRMRHRVLLELSAQSGLSLEELQSLTEPTDEARTASDATAGAAA